MSRVSEILLRARDRLADTQKKRFSDARLIRLLSEAQEQVATTTKVLRTEATFSLTPFTSKIQLPDNCFAVLRVEWEGVKLAMKSYDEMDEAMPEWKTVVAPKPTAVVYNLRDAQELQLWPTLAYDEIAPYGLVSSMTGATSAETVGIAESLIGSVAIGQPTYGVLATVQVATPSVTVQYARLPKKVEDYGELEVPAAFDTALKSYVVGMALMDNMDLQNSQIANTILEQAGAEVALISRTLRSDFTTLTQYNSTYNGGF